MEEAAHEGSRVSDIDWDAYYRRLAESLAELNALEEAERAHARDRWEQIAERAAGARDEAGVEG